MLTDAEKVIRRKSIGSSDVPKILGFTNFGGPATVWLDKVRGHSFEGNLRTEIGSALEAPIMGLAWNLGKLPGYIDFTKGRYCQHPIEQWASCTPDFILHASNGDRAIAEVKNVEWSEQWGKDRFPLQYMTQIQWQMFVTGIRKAYCVALINGSDIRVYPVDYDEASIGWMVRTVRDYYQKYIVGQETIPAGYTPDYSKYLREKWGSPDGKRFVPSDEQLDALATELQAYKLQASEAEKEKTRCENEIKQFLAMRMAYGVEGQDWRATWSRHGEKSRFHFSRKEK